MHTDIDMSGRIEETNKPTTLALANGISASLLITAREKRLAIATLLTIKPEHERKMIHVLIFSTLLYFLLRDHIQRISLVIIDPEYEGYEPLIKNRVLSLCQNQGIPVTSDQIAFGRVGKRSPAHALALSVFRGEKLPDRTVRAEELIATFRKKGRT